MAPPQDANPCASLPPPAGRLGLAAAHGRRLVKTRRARAAAAVRVSSGEGGDGAGTGITAAAAATVVLAVMNRVLYKLALVPMKDYPFFLAQVLTFGYVIVYFSILFIRYRAGIVSKEMLALPKSRFMLIGLLEAMGVASGMAAAAMLTGPSIPVLSQVMNSARFLLKRLNALECLFVVCFCSESASRPASPRMHLIDDPCL